MTDTRIGPGRVLVVDDHELVGCCLVAALRSEGEDAVHHRPTSVAGIARTASATGPGLVLLDLELGRDLHGEPIDGASAVPRLVTLGWRVLVLSGTSDGAPVGAALAAGGFGWMHKNAPFPALLSTIREARAGRPVMPPGRRERLIELHGRRVQECRAVAGKLALLGPCELEVLGALATGMRVRAVADRHGVTAETVRARLRTVLATLAVATPQEAVALFRRGGGPLCGR